MKLKKYIAPLSFYQTVSMIAIPIILQQIVETFVGLADSMMVSAYSSIGVGAVQIGSQWEQIASLFSFGICSGVGIYIAQFYGGHNYAKLKKSFGLMLMMSLIASIPFILLAVLFPKVICGFYINDQEVITQGAKYLVITGISYIFIMISYSFNYTYRCMKKTKVTMIISSISVLANCILNYLFIFGHYGFVELGIPGAALATLIARALGTLCYISYSYYTKQVFIGNLREMFRIDWNFAKPILKRIFPTVVNEGFFGLGQTLYFKAFGMIGVGAVTSVAIADRIANLFFMIIWAIVSSVQSIIGNTLGNNEIEKARQTADYFMGLAVVVSIILGCLMASSASTLINMLYTNESATVKHAATMILFAYSIKIALRLFNAIIFGLLRAGGDTKVLALLDSVILYSIGLPLAFLGVTIFNLNIIITILIIQIEQIVRIILAFIRYKSGAWLQNVTLDMN